MPEKHHLGYFVQLSKPFRVSSSRFVALIHNGIFVSFKVCSALRATFFRSLMQSRCSFLRC